MDMNKVNCTHQSIMNIHSLGQNLGFKGIPSEQKGVTGNIVKSQGARDIHGSGYCFGWNCIRIFGKGGLKSGHVNCGNPKFVIGWGSQICNFSLARIFDAWNNVRKCGRKGAILKLFGSNRNRRSEGGTLLGDSVFDLISWSIQRCRQLPIKKYGVGWKRECGGISRRGGVPISGFEGLDLGYLIFVGVISIEPRNVHVVTANVNFIKLNWKHL